MPDIFDQIAPQSDIFDKVAMQPKGDIFDQISAPSADTGHPISADYVPQDVRAPGNIDLTKRPVVKNADGSISTVRSMSFNEDGKEVLIPTVSNEGKIMTSRDAIDYYHKTGQHLGKFDSPDEANAYAQKLHKQQEAMYSGSSGNSLTRPFKAQTYESAKALNQGIAGFSQRLDNIAQYISDKTGLDKTDIFGKAAKVYAENADYWDKKAQEVGTNVIDEIVGSAVGGAVPGIAEFMLNVPFSALSGAAEAHKKGESELAGAATEGLKRGLLGQIFHAAGSLNKPLATVATGGAMAAQTASEGGSPEEIAKSAGVGALYGATGGGELGFKDIKESVKSDLGRVIGYNAKDGKPIIDMEAAKPEAAPTPTGDIFDKITETQKEVIPSGEVNKEGRQEGGQGRDEGLLNQPEAPISNEQGPSTKEAPAPVPVDRRKDLETRKKVAEMNPEDMRKELLTDELTGLGNKRAYDEALADPAKRKPVQVSADVDGLKWINDNFGHEFGDMLLKTKATILKEEGIDAYRKQGDEFFYQFDTPEQANETMKRVADKLKNATLELTKPDGTVILVKGAGFSYGKGSDPATADTALLAEKQRREAQGDRATRGERPPGLVEVGKGAGEPSPGNETQDTKVDKKRVATNDVPPFTEAPSDTSKTLRNPSDSNIAPSSDKGKPPSGSGSTADAGGYAKEHPQAMELPEIVEIANGLMGGKYPYIARKLRALKGTAAGVFQHPAGKIGLKASIFKDVHEASRVLAHEIGHLVDWLPDKDMKRGNILGRIATLHKYLKHTLQGDIFDSKPGEGFTKQEVMTELKNLTQILKPFDDSLDPNYTKYRYSSKELYADAFSTLVNNPQLLKDTAPKFTEGLFNYFDRKPEVKTLYDEIQNRLTDKKSVYDKRAENIQEMFARGEKAYASKLNSDSRKWAEKFKENFIDANEAIIRKVKEAKASGKDISPEDNPVFWLEEATYKNSQIKEFLRDIGNKVMDPLEKAGLSQNDLAEYLFHNRVVHERGELANPLGHTPETSTQQLEVMKGKLGEEKYSKLVKAAEDFRAIRKETVIPFLKESKMFSDELIKKIEDNEHYATFNVVDFLEEKNGKGAGISSQIFKQYGTLSEITSPFTATVMKDMALVRAANNKMAAEKTIDFLKEHFSSDIRNADTEWNGRAQVPVEPKDPNLGMIRYLNNGKVEAHYVDKFIADSFARNPSEAGLVAEVLRSTNIVWKELFVNRNPGFWLFNIIRDYRRAALNLQGASIIKFLPEYAKAIKPAFRGAFDIPDDVVRAMNQKKMLVSIESRKGLSAEDTQIERMLYSYGLKESKWNNLILKRFGKIWDYWGKIGEGIEKIPKIGGYNYLKKHTNLSDKEIGHIVRTQVGSPDFLRKGISYNLYNNLYLFSNAIKEGWRGDIEVMKARPAEYAWKTAKYSIIPKMIMYGAGLGLLGAWMKKSMDNASDFDKTNYIIIPMGESENGKGIYFRIPMDETGRFLGGVLWKALTAKKAEDITNLFDFMAGQAPNMTPTVSLVSSLIQYFSGKNPYDWFRGQTVIPERTFEAGGWRSHKEFLKFMANQAGAGIIYKFSTDEVNKVKIESEKILGLPIVSNIIGRFIKISDTGQRQELKDIARGARRKAINQQLDVKDRIIESINDKNGKPSVADVKRLYIDLLKEKGIEPDISFMEFRHRYTRYASKAKDGPKVDAIVNATSDDEKAALLRHYKETMNKEDYDKLLRQLMVEGHLKKGALAESFRPAKP